MEVVFYDLETTIPPTDIIEFGGIVLDKTGLYERESYSTLIHSTRITPKSTECNGITLDMVKDSPSFADVADNIFNILDGRIWAGHNIINFDNRCIAAGFEKIGKPAPKPAGLIDTLPLLRSTFGPRAGNLKMASLGNYFGLGQERHRAIEDCRMTLEVLKNCAMTMFLEEHVGYAGADMNPPVAEKVDSNPTIEKLNEAMKGDVDIWISYDGGSNPLVPRKIKPTKWVHEPWMFEAFCHQGQCDKNFSQRKIREIRDKEWTIEKKEESVDKDS
jgi:DNA polymerase III epsilon subunit-like protein